MPWKMPAEWHRHERTWMAWPSAAYTLGESPAEASEGRSAWAAVANAVAAFEPLTMLVTQAEMAEAKRRLDGQITLVEAELDDAWMRDIGPSFVFDEAGRLGAVDWVFNGWGAQPWASWSRDARVGATIADLAGATLISSELVNEGGGIHVNGQGTVLVTETVQLGASRNPGWSRSQVEAELTSKLGADRVVWLERGLYRDYDEFGTQGHIDIVACFAGPNRILYHEQRAEEHPDFERSIEFKKRLEGTGFELVPLPAPRRLRDDQDWVDYSYVNHYLVNDGVILCSFDDPMDEVAKATLEEMYPERKVVLVDARPLFARGGGIHCITQQQPAFQSDGTGK